MAQPNRPVWRLQVGEEAPDFDLEATGDQAGRRGFVAGHTMGRPGDEALHKWMIMDALGLLLESPRPGEVVRRD